MNIERAGSDRPAAAPPPGSGSPPISRLLRILRHVAKGLLLFAAGTVLFHAVVPPVYRFPPPRPFSGPYWYNPYQPPGNRWLRANFHAHSRNWVNYRSTEAPAGTLRSAYRGQGYDISGISNYQNIVPPDVPDDLYIPVYEHGYGATQQHQTVIGASSVSWLEFPFFQDLAQKQAVIDRLTAGEDVVVLNHPNKHDSYPPSDMNSLAGYTGIEVATRYADGLPDWEAALRAGRPVWGFCGDDCHKIKPHDQFAIGWLMIGTDGRTPAAVMASLKTGRFYGVSAKSGLTPNALVSCGIADNRLTVVCAEPAWCIQFFVRGRPVNTVRGVASASYDLRDEDACVRVEIITRETVLYLNPVLRISDPQVPGRPPPGPRAEVRPAATWSLRGAGFLALALLAARLYGRR